MNRMLTVLRWEFKRAAANKAFVIMTIIGPFLILGMTVLPSLLVREQAMAAGSKLAVAGATPGELSGLVAAFSQAGLTAGGASADLAGDKRRILSGELTGLLALEPDWTLTGRLRLYTKTGSEVMLFGIVDSVLGTTLREARMKASGLDPALLAPILSQPKLEVIKLAGTDGEGKGVGREDFLSPFFAVLSLVMLIYMSTLLYGQLIGRSVVLEKSSKTVEIMLSSVSPRELLFGKVLGMGAAALLQYAVWAGAGLLITQVFGPALRLSLSLPAMLTPANIGWLVVFFLLGFFLYATAYAGLGAAAEDEQQLGQLAWPVIVFLIIPIVFVSNFLMNPDSTLARVLSLFPLTSPIVMFIRVLVSPPPAWELGLSIALVLATIYGTGLLSARIFRVGILMTGKRGSFGEMWRWIREKEGAK